MTPRETNRDDMHNLVRSAAKAAIEAAPLGTPTAEYPALIAAEVMQRLDKAVLTVPQYAVDMAAPSTILNALAFRVEGLGR